MKKRKTRLPEIIDILTHNNIGSQEELSQQLAERGYSVTQATLSRDLKMLRTTKVTTEMGGYRYIIPDNAAADSAAAEAYDQLMRPTALSIAISGNTVVLKTRNGYAGGLAYDIDMIESPHILGTIAGADTVFAIIDEKSSRRRIFEVFASILPREVMEEARDCFFGPGDPEADIDDHCNTPLSTYEHQS